MEPILNPLLDTKSTEEGSNLNPLQDKQSIDEKRTEQNEENDEKTTEEDKTAGKDEEEGKVMKESTAEVKDGNEGGTDELESKEEGNMDGDDEKMDTEAMHDGEDINGIDGGENGMENDLEDLESDAPSLKVLRYCNKLIAL